MMKKQPIKRQTANVKKRNGDEQLNFVLGALEKKVQVGPSDGHPRTCRWWIYCV